VMLPEEKRSAAVVDEARKTFAGVANTLTQALTGRPYLLGNEFSAADVMLGSTLAWGSFMGLLEGQPVLTDYVKRLTERPAYQRAQGK
jgi:glutathione S-transferase